MSSTARVVRATSSIIAVVRDGIWRGHGVTIVVAISPTRHVWHRLVGMRIVAGHVRFEWFRGENGLVRLSVRRKVVREQT